MDQVLPGGTAATAAPAVVASTPAETSVSPARTTEVRVVSTQLSSNAAAAETARNRRLCEYTTGQMQRYDGKPHSIAECEVNPDAYLEKIGDDNRRIVAEQKAQGKSIDNLPDGRPLESRMISWQIEIEDFRLDQSFASIDAVMTTVDIFDTWGNTLKISPEQPSLMVRGRTLRAFGLSLRLGSPTLPGHASGPWPGAQEEALA